jgi:hypothetical protein
MRSLVDDDAGKESRRRKALEPFQRPNGGLVEWSRTRSRRRSGPSPRVTRQRWRVAQQEKAIEVHTPEGVAAPSAVRLP